MYLETLKLLRFSNKVLLVKFLARKHAITTVVQEVMVNQFNASWDRFHIYKHILALKSLCLTTACWQAGRNQP